MGTDDFGCLFCCRPCKIILIKYIQLGQICLHGIRSHQGEEGINTIFGKIVRQSAEEKATQCAPKSKGFWIPLTIMKAPRCKIERCEVMREISIASSKSNSVTEDSATDGITCRSY